MSKTLLILKNDFREVITKKSFLITLFLLPLIGLISLFVISAVQKSTGADAGSMMQNLFTPTAKITMEGYIDHSGLIKTIPPGYENRIKSFANEDEAKKAISDGDISAYYIIGETYLEDGKIIYVRPDFNPIGGSMQSDAIDALTSYALTNGNLDLAYRIQNPVNTIEVSLTETEHRDSSNPLTFIIPYAVTMLFYVVILTSASLLLSSITNEKQNRMMEILMTSITPLQMLTGKIIALGLAGLLQTVVWIGSGMMMLRLSGQAFALSSAFQLPPSFLIWAILFFVSGYAVYASLMAGIGALVPNIREASQTTTVVIIPLVIPLVLINSLIQTPDSSLSVFLSIFPLTAPVSMMTRISAMQVPVWQILLSLFLVILTAVLLIRAIAGLFRTQNLLAGKAFSPKEFLKLLFAKA